jgi:signal transduction histidine kinase
MLVEPHPTVLGGNALTYRIGSISFLGMPLLVKGRLEGAITLRAEPDRRYASADLHLVEQLGHRASLAIENAQLYRHAQEAVRARDELLTIAAHEIRGPVTSIHLGIQALLQRRVPPDAMSRAFELIEREDRRLSRFINELLELGLMRAGRLQLDLEEVNLAAVIQEVVKRFGAELAASGSTLTTTAPANLIGEWDRFRLEQVVTNLLSNAIKFGLGEPIEVAASSSGERARLSVRDHGVGVEPSARERIFDAFERNVSARHYGGLGIGLHIVKTIVAGMGGSVRVESKPGAGSTFIVELPLKLTPEPSDEDPRH